MHRFLFVVLACVDCTPDLPVEEPVTLPIIHASAASRAEHGRSLLEVDSLGEGLIPRTAIENLWLVWGEESMSDYWPAFRKRYGLYEAPFANDGLPMGIRRKDANNVTIDCLLCHASVVAGQTMVGVANSLLDFQGLVGDLEKLADATGRAPPVRLRNRTGAAGANDAVGLAFVLAEQRYNVPAGTRNTEIGFQRPPAWWQLKYKRRAYNDGSGEAPSFRIMAGIFMGAGLRLAQIEDLADEVEDVGQYILSLDAPRWPFESVRRDEWTRGRVLFEDRCSECHGTYHGEGAQYPDRIVPLAEVGTDPLRSQRFGKREVDAINASWFGQPPMQVTDGYLAPALVGVWARAPYFHNGSVPDLWSVLSSAERPSVWQRTGFGAEEFDSDKVGWRYTVPSDRGDIETIAGRKIYDTARPGLSNAGHTFGDDLTEGERKDLIAYLKSL